MTKHDWFRNRTWSESIARAFFARLERSRSIFHKAQYLRIQALTLEQTRVVSHVRIALELLQRVFVEFPDGSQLAAAHLQAARCHAELGDVATAVDQFRAALDAQSRCPGYDPGTALEFPWFVVERELSSHYDEALEVLATARLAFPVQYFQAAAVRAFVAEFRGDPEAASRNAREALGAAERQESGFRYHQSLGLVGDTHEATVARLKKLAAA